MRRLTERPFTIKVDVSETAANTFTEKAINSPAIPVIGTGKFQALELMKVRSELPPPTAEAGQNNNLRAHLSKDTQSGGLTTSNPDEIWGRIEYNQQVEVTAVGEMGNANYKGHQIDDMTDGDGNGRLIHDRVFYFGLKGTGLPAANTGYVELLCHLVEMDADEVTSLLLEKE